MKLDLRISMFDEKIEFSIPKKFGKMPKSMWEVKYRNLPMPDLVLTDPDGEINLLLNKTDNEAGENELEEYKNFRIRNLQNQRKDISILDQGVKIVNGIKISFFKFSSLAVDQGVFNFYFFIILEGKIVTFTFNCIRSLQKTWEKTADAIMESVTVKKDN